MVIYTTNSGVLEFLEEHDLLVLTGRAFTLSEDLLEMMDRLTVYCKSRQLYDVLYNLSDWEGLLNHEMFHYLIHEHAPKLLLADIETHAVVVPKDKLAAMTTDLLRQELNPVLKIEVFDDKKTAMDWLFMERAKRHFPFSKN